MTTSNRSRPTVHASAGARWKPLAAGLVTALACSAAMAQQPAPGGMEERLRAQLRVTTSQLQQAQNELSALKASAAPAAKAAPAAATATAAPAEVAELKKALARAESQLASERQARAQAAEGSQQLRAQSQAAAEKSSAQVAQYRNAYDELLKMARASEAERQRLAAESALQRTAATQCEAKNAQLYAVGQEILKAYETLDLGSVLASRQPFAAQSRVKYEQIAQQYGDKLYEGRFDARSVSVPAPAADAAKPAP